MIYLLCKYVFNNDPFDLESLATRIIKIQLGYIKVGYQVLFAFSNEEKAYLMLDNFDKNYHFIISLPITSNN